MNRPKRRRQPATRMSAARDGVVAALAEALRDQPLSSGKVGLAWSVAVGDAVARLTTVTLEADGTVAATAPDARWARELGQSRPLLIRRMNDMLGAGAVKRLDITSTPRSDGRRNRRPRS